MQTFRLSARARRVAGFAAVGLWLSGAAVGLGALAAYGARPGVAAEVAASWPADSHLTRGAARPTLVLALHPGCSCSRATLAELAKLDAKVGGAFDAIVLVVSPAAGDPAFRDDALAKLALESVPRATLVDDPGGREAELFGARTSGQVFLFAPSGKRLFAGGITASRAHEGDNAGEDALADVLSRNHPRIAAPSALAATPVYGCSLVTPPSSGAIR